MRLIKYILKAARMIIRKWNRFDNWGLELTMMGNHAKWMNKVELDRKIKYVRRMSGGYPTDEYYDQPTRH